MSQLAPPQLKIRLFFSALGVLQLVTLLLAFEKPAAAYIDPGSGYVFLQVAGSMLAGSVFYLRHRLKKLFCFRRIHEEAPAASVKGRESP